MLLRPSRVVQRPFASPSSLLRAPSLLRTPALGTPARLPSSIRHASTAAPAPSRPRDDRIVTSKPMAYPGLMSRDPDRPLPSLKSLSSSRKWLTTIPIFALLVAISAIAIFNYQKTNSPVVTAILYSLRTTPAVRDLLGNEVYFASKWAWIFGEINLVQGRIDVNFGVGGTKQKGTVRFRARRVGGRAGRFKTDEWSLTSDDGTVMDLLQDGDPLEGSAL